MEKTSENLLCDIFIELAEFKFDENELIELNSSLLEQLWLNEDSSEFSITGCELISFAYILSKSIEEHNRAKRTNPKAKINKPFADNILAFMGEGNELLNLHDDIGNLLKADQGTTERTQLIKLMSCINLAAKNYIECQDERISQLLLNESKISA